MDDTNTYLLEVDGLKTYFPIRKGLLRRTVGNVKAVDGVSFRIKKSHSLGLVGESGCGKTTVARSIVRLVPATEGRIVFDHIDILSARVKESNLLHRDISIIFQDPYASLNPRMTIGDIVSEPLKVQMNLTGREVLERVGQLLTKVGLSTDHINRYPHEFSGGQRQRIGIARALALEPRLVICDEPVSALDVSIQSQILNLLKDLQDEFGLTFLFIAHDLAVVEFFCDIVVVMYMGRIVEQAGSKELYRNPLHPYTHTLLSAIPKLQHRSGEAKQALVKPPSGQSEHTSMTTELPSNIDSPDGCSFYPRCALRDEICLKKVPYLEKTADDAEHLVACWKCRP
ncbi:ABC transporter ATP-binding protein [Planctomycetota bacterium]